MSFEPPEFWSFPPFFTLQPVSETREKQLRLWKDLVLNYHLQQQSYVMTPSAFPYFENKSIGRKLNEEGVGAVVQFLISQGNAEWEDSGHTRLRVLWKTPDALAADIYSWATKNGFLGNIFTYFELISGDEYQDSGFHGMDSTLFRRALQILERANKCAIIEGSTQEEDGIKFL